MSRPTPQELELWAELAEQLAVRPARAWEVTQALTADQARLLAFVAITVPHVRKQMATPSRERPGPLKPNLSFLEQWQELHSELGLRDCEIPARMSPPIEPKSYLRMLARYGLPHDGTLSEAS